MEMMKLAVFALVSLASAGLSHAQLGATFDQANEKFGPVIEKRKATLPQCDPDAVVFSKDGITMIVEFRQGKASRLVFRKPVIETADVDRVLKENANGQWSQPLKYDDRQYRLSADGQTLAILLVDRKNQVLRLELLSKECVSAGFAQYMAQLQKPGSVETLRLKTNPLPGF